MSKPIIEIDHLTFAYEEEIVLDDIQWTIHEGDFWGLFGPNGSGKSTLLKCILGQLKPQGGEVRVMGKPTSHWKNDLTIGYVSQKSNSFNRGFPATVQEVVASGLTGKKGLFRWFHQKDWEKIDKALKQVGLIDLKKQNIGRLSGGQQQRVFIARALVADPKILVLDEPTVGMDVKSIEAFYKLLTQLSREKKLTLLLVTHEMEVFSAYVKQVACLNRRLIFKGEVEDFNKQREKIIARCFEQIR